MFVFPPSATSPLNPASPHAPPFHSASPPFSLVLCADGQPKVFTIAYFVYEKPAPCGDYPPDGEVVFFNINLFCGNKVVSSPAFKTAYVDDVCNNRAHVLNSSALSITWDTKAQDPAKELIDRHQADHSLGFHRGGSSSSSQAAEAPTPALRH